MVNNSIFVNGYVILDRYYYFAQYSYLLNAVNPL